MNATDFARKRARIERDHHGRGRRYTKELAHLVRDSRAILVVKERKVVGYRLPNGEIVCVKVRYRDEAHANADIERIQAGNHSGDRVPQRAYYCVNCYGYHVTSQLRHAA